MRRRPVDPRRRAHAPSLFQCAIAPSPRFFLADMSSRCGVSVCRFRLAQLVHAPSAALVHTFSSFALPARDAAVAPLAPYGVDAGDAARPADARRCHFSCVQQHARLSRWSRLPAAARTKRAPRYGAVAKTTTDDMPSRARCRCHPPPRRCAAPRPRDVHAPERRCRARDAAAAAAMPPADAAVAAGALRAARTQERPLTRHAAAAIDIEERRYFAAGPLIFAPLRAVLRRAYAVSLLRSFAA